MKESYERNTETVDAVFEALADERRRYALHCLKEHETPLALADLAEEVAVQENSSPITEVTAEDVKRTYMSLYHTHIPKLEDAGIVRYNQDADGVVLSDDSDRLEQYTNSV